LDAFIWECRSCFSVEYPTTTPAASFLTPAAVGASANAATGKAIQVATDSPAADARGVSINATRNIQLKL
jgi:hypothetical protein